MRSESFPPDWDNLASPRVDYVPTAPVHKTRRAIRRASWAGITGAIATAAFFMPPEWPALAALIAMAIYFIFK